MRIVWTALAAAAFASALAAPAVAQDLADFDYANLSFRGIGVHVGYIFPDRVESAASWGVRADLGYVGPGVRIVPSLGYWSSALDGDEIRALEESVERLIDRENPPDAPPASVDLGTIDRSDLVLAADAHVVWGMPRGFLGYTGAGVAVHFMDGDGESIDGTFVEDLLDSVGAGLNLHVGLEYAGFGRVRPYGEGRYEIMGDLRYPEVRGGLQFMVGGPAPGGEPAR